jgi:hypothetical protein
MNSNFDYIAFINGTIQTIVGHPLDTLKTWRQSNIKGRFVLKSLFRGVSYPLATNSIVNHIQFNLMEQKYDNWMINYGLTVGFTSLFLTPIEYFKIRRQNNLKISFPKGLGITLLREIPGCITYFGIIRNFKSVTGIDSDFLTGGVAGTTSWLLCYPFDTIKTKIQSDVPFKNAIRGPYYNGLSYCLVRGFIANALGYYCYVKLKDFLK